MSTENDADVEDIKREIEIIVTREIASRGYCYLARLGVALGREKISVIKVATGLGLSSFIANFMRDKFAQVAIGGRKSELVIVGVGDKNKFDARDNIQRQEHRKPRFNRSLWLAFAVPASGGNRYFNLRQRTFFDGVRPEGDEWREIPVERLRTDENDYDILKIAENIEAWLAENSLTKADFSEPDASIEAAGSALTPTAQGLSVLDILLRSLDRRQLHSVSLPLDVVETLLRKRI